MTRSIKQTCSLLALVLGLGLWGLSTQAGAQSIDYSSAEALFEEPVTASATGAPIKVTDAPVNMTIISQTEIRASGAVSLYEVMTRLASVDMLRFSRSDPQISVRGYDQPLSPRLLVLVNGRQVYLDHFAETDWNLIPVQVSEVRQIEVVRGPNTALFGFNAVAGVINIVTYDPIFDKVNEIQAIGGTGNYRQGGLVLSHRFGKDLGLRFSFGSKTSDPFKGEKTAVAASGLDHSTNPTSLTTNLSLAYQFNATVRGDFEYSWAKDNKMESIVDFPDYSAKYTTASFKAGLAADTQHGLISWQAYLNTLSTVYPSTGSQQDRNRIFVTDLSWLFTPAAGHTVRLVGEFRRNIFKESLQNWAADLHYDVWSASGMWTWNLNPKLMTSLSVRVDDLSLTRSGPNIDPNAATPTAPPSTFPYQNSDYNTHFTEPSINAGVVWKPLDKHVIRLTYGRGIQSPSLYEYGSQYRFNGDPTYYTGYPKTRPTITQNVELGWDREISIWSSRLRASVYWQDNKDLKVLYAEYRDLGNGYFESRANNVGSSELTGFELGLEGKRDGWHWRADYSHREVKDSLSLAPLSATYNFEATTPKDVATAALDWTQGKWSIAGDLRYVGDTKQFTGIVAPYGLVKVKAHVFGNARIAYAVTPKLDLAVSVRNLFSDRVKDTTRAPVDREVFVFATQRF